MVCPLCGARRARRGCPALDKDICAVCCGTKRLAEIRCPSSCTYLASAREHPPASVARQQQRDAAYIVPFLRDLSDRQSQLFFTIATFVVRYVPDDLHLLVDDDVADMAEAMAATFETAARGVIYEHAAASLPAQRLAAALRPHLQEAAAPHAAGSVFERDAAVVLRRVQDAARGAKALAPHNRRALVEMLARLFRAQPGSQEAGAFPPEPARVIVP